MIELTKSELDLVLAGLAESSYYEPDYDHDLVEQVREMLLEKLANE